MTNILSIDTSSKHPSISISNGTEIRSEYNFTSDDSLSTTLIPVIEFLLSQAELKLENIDAFGIATGPGLFTGIRVGVSTLKGLIFGREKPVVPVVTLRALAYKCYGSEFTVIPLIDAKRDEIYFAAYDFSGMEMKETVSPELVHVSDLEKRIKSFDAFCFIGSGAEVHENFIKNTFCDREILRRSPFLSWEWR